MSKRVSIYDSTLRGSDAWPGGGLPDPARADLARRLDSLGVTYIEVGWPADNPADLEFSRQFQQEPFKIARAAAAAVLRGPAVPAEDNEDLKALLSAATPVCTLVGHAWRDRVLEDRGLTPDAFLTATTTGVEFLKSEGREVIFDAEHFFDGFKADPAYALAALEAATRGGADTLVLSDTSGGMLPWEAGKLVHQVRVHLPEARLGIGMLNDAECAVANTVAAISQGVVHVQGSINGYGSGAGQANLSNIIPDLELKMGLDCLPSGKLPDLLEISQFLANLMTPTSAPGMPYVGRSDAVPV
jgi:2-isopropylmalate synthase